ncbi:MAG: twin-arginine translocase subunit TatC [Elusimicrobiota bacterium]
MDPSLPLPSHLDELRRRLLYSLAFFACSFAASFNYSTLLFRIIKHPLAGIVDKLVFFSPTEALAVYLNISFTSGLIFSMPFLLYQAWKFIEPAAGSGLRNNVFVFVGGVMAAFSLGVVFSYFILIPPALKFLLGFAGAELQPVISAQNYISFITWTVVGTGLVFEMPVLSYILTKLGVINHRLLRSKYRYALVAILIVAAIITPTSDIFNMLLFTAPMVVLYELSIWISKFAESSRN